MSNKPTDALINYVLGVFETRVMEDVVVGPTSFEFTVVHPHDSISYTKLITRLAHKQVRDVVFRPTRSTYAGKAYHGIKVCVRTDTPDAECERFAEDLRVERRHKGPGAGIVSDVVNGGSITPTEMKMMMEVFHALFERHPIDGNRVVPYRPSPDRIGFIIACVRPSSTSATTTTQNSDGALSINELGSMIDLVKRIVGSHAFEDVVLVNSAHVPAFCAPGIVSISESGGIDTPSSTNLTSPFIPITSTSSSSNSVSTAALSSSLGVLSPQSSSPSSISQTREAGMGRLCLRVLLKPVSRKRAFVA